MTIFAVKPPAKDQNPQGFGSIAARRILQPLLLCLVLLSGHSTLAQQSAGQSSAEQSTEEYLSINMHDADIGAVIQWISEKTHKQIVVDPRVKGNITVLANEPMTIDQAYQVFLAAMDVYGYSAVENGGILRIFPASMVNTAPSAIVENYQQLGGNEQIVYVYQANNVSASRLGQLLQPLIANTGYLNIFAESNSLILADDAANVKRLIDLLRQIDNSGDFNIQVIPLQHAAADKVAGVVSSLVVTPGDKNQQFAIASDMRSNSLLMSGNPATRQQVQRLISQLDQPISATGTTRVIYLHYLDAKEVLPILKSISDSAKEADKNTHTAQTPISIESSESANALVLTAPPDLLDQMEKVIREIDIRRSQVLVEAIIVEVSSDFSESIGVEWNTNLAQDNNVEAMTNLGLRSTASASLEDASSVISLLGDGLSLGFYRNGSLRALAQAIANQSDANILSTPSILTLDNQQAEILVGSNVPFISGQSTSGGSSTADPFTTIERQDIGLTLKITPKINQGDAVTLEVLQEIETINDSTDVTSDIVTNKRSIKTKVLVDNNTVLVLGGLISDEQQQLENKVPFLGDIPLIGQLFRSTTEKLTKKNLMVFIHPVIIKSEPQAQQVTAEKYQHMKNLQENVGSEEVENKEMLLKDFDSYYPRKNSDSENSN